MIHTKRLSKILLATLLTAPALGQVGPALALPSTQPAAAKLFRSRLAGIELLPPAGGTLIRQLDTGEIVRFVYNDRGWDIRVKPVPLHMSMTLSDLVDLSAKQLLESNPSAEIVMKHVVNVGGKDLGVIEARYNAGADRLFTQQALVRSDDESYFLIQMGSPTNKAKNASPEPVDPQESEAHTAFNAMLPTVNVLDRSELRKEQESRLRSTFGLWVQLDKRKIADSLIPLHFMRVIHDGKDVGFVQMNERLASHAGNPGVEIIVRSRIDEWPADSDDAAKNVAAVKPAGFVLPQPLAAVPEPNVRPKPPTTFSSSIYFFSFDRPSGFVASHEDWETTSQIDEQKAAQVTELGNSDLAEHRVLDAARALNHAKAPGGDQQPPVIERPEYLLSVSQYQHERRLGRAFECELGWSYLPVGLRQILPRLLPTDPKLYMFADYENTQHKILRRYIDVDPAVDVILDGKSFHAVPISDRIGVDGIPTVHYVTRDGEWLGSRNEGPRLDVLPATADQLAKIWPKFTVCPEPPLPTDPAPAMPGAQPRNSPASP